MQSKYSHIAAGVPNATYRDHAPEDASRLAAGGDFNHVPFMLLSMFVFFAPAMPMPSKSTIGFISPALVGVLGLFIAYNILTRRPIMVINNYITSIFCCYLVLMLSDVFCIVFFETAKQAPYLIARTATLILFVTAVSYKPSIELIEQMIRIYCWSIAALSVLVILEGLGFVSLGAETRQGRLYFGIRLPFKKAVGFPMSDGEFGIMVAPAFFYCILQFFGGPDYKPMKFRTLALFLTAMGLLIAQSRSTWLGMVFALPIMIILIPRRTADRLLVGLAGATFAIFVGTQIYADILAGFVSEGILATTATRRFVGFNLALELAKEAPLFGHGHGTRILASARSPEGKVVHNHFIDALSAGGLLAFIPTIALYGLVVAKMVTLIEGVATAPTIRLLSIWVLGSIILAVTELFFYRGFYSEHLPWLIGTSCMLFSIQHGWKRVVL